VIPVLLPLLHPPPARSSGILFLRRAKRFLDRKSFRSRCPFYIFVSANENVLKIRKSPVSEKPIQSPEKPKHDPNPKNQDPLIRKTPLDPNPTRIQSEKKNRTNSSKNQTVPWKNPFSKSKPSQITRPGEKNHPEPDPNKELI